MNENSITPRSDIIDISDQSSSNNSILVKEERGLKKISVPQSNLLRVPTFASPTRLSISRLDRLDEQHSPRFILSSNDSRSGIQGFDGEPKLKKIVSSYIFRRMSLHQPVRTSPIRGLSPSQSFTRQNVSHGSKSPSNSRSKGLIKQVRQEQKATKIKRQKTLLEQENDRLSRLSLRREVTQNTIQDQDWFSVQSIQEEVDLNGLNAFHRAASDHNINMIMELMEIFPEADYNPKIWLDVPNKHGVTPLSFACMFRHKGKLQDRQKFIEFLLQNGADPNSCNKYTYFTPLHWACRYGDVEIVADLLRGGATPFTPDSKGYFPIDFAGIFNHKEVIKVLVDYSIKKFESLKQNQYRAQEVELSQINSPPKNFGSVFQYRHEFMLSSFYATKLLYWASIEQSVELETVEKILNEMEAYPEGCLSFMFKQTPLHAAALSGNEAKLQIMIDDYLERQKIRAYYNNFKEQLRQSLRFKLGLTLQNFQNIKLIEREAPYRKKCIIGESHHNVFLQVLNVKRLSQVKQTYFYNFWTHINEMHKRGSVPNIQDFNGNSPLHLSALKNNVKCTQLLTEQYAASIDLRNIDGIMAKDIGAWYPETYHCFNDYYNLVDTMIQASSQTQNQFTLEFIRTVKSPVKKNRHKRLSQSISFENMICANENDMQALFRRIVSQEEAKGILSKELMLSRPYIPHLPLVAMKFNINSHILREKLNSILRQLSSSCFKMSIFKGVDADTIFVVLNLTEEDLEKEATAIGFPVKLHSISAKAPFSPDNKGNIEPFLPKDKQQIMVQKIDTLFNIQDLLRQQVLVSIFPLHDFNGLYYIKAVKKGRMLTRIKTEIVQYFMEDFKNTKFSNLIAYKNYFGEKMCIMHAFFHFYTVWFAFPAFLSLILCLYQLYTKEFDVIACVIFAFCISVWSTIFVEMWKRKEYHIQTQWGIVTSASQDNDTTLNPDFIGYNKFSWSNYGVGKKGKYLETKVILALNILASVAMIGMTIAAYLAIKKYTKFNYYIKGLGISAITGCFNVLYKEMAAKFVIWENHKYLKDKDGSFMLKIVAFSTINTNLPIVYTILFPDPIDISDKPDTYRQSQQILAELGLQAEKEYITSISHSELYAFLYGIVLGALTAKILSAIFTRYFYRYVMFHFYRMLYFRKMHKLGRQQQSRYQDEFEGLSEQSLAEVQLKENLHIYEGVFNAKKEGSNIGKVNPVGRPTPPKPVYQRLIFNNEDDKEAADCSEHVTYLIDAVEINSIMPVKTELMKTSDMTEKLQLIGLSLLYAGICPIGTAIVFVYFIIDDMMATYTDCYCMRRPLQENQMSLGNWSFVVEFIVGFVTISNSAVLFLVSDRFGEFLTNTLKIAPKNHLWVVGCFEHFLLMMIILTKVFIPDFPRALKKFYENQKKELDRLFEEQKKDKFKVLQRENKRLSEAIQLEHLQSPKQLISRQLQRKNGSVTDFFNLNNAQKSNDLMVSTLEHAVYQNLKQRLLRETFLRIERNILESKLSKLCHMSQTVTIACAICQFSRAEVQCDQCGKHLCGNCLTKSYDDHRHFGTAFQQTFDLTPYRLRFSPSPQIQQSPQSPKGQARQRNGKAVWKKLESFDFGSSLNKTINKERIQKFYDSLIAIYLELNDISLQNGTLDIAAMFIDRNQVGLPKEIAFKYADKYKKRLQGVTSVLDLIETDQLNDEERFIINRLVYLNLAKDSHLSKVETLIQQLDILQNGNFDDKLHLWLYGLHMLDVKLNEGINQPQLVAKSQSHNFSVPRHLFRSTVLASHPQELECGLAVDSIIVTLFVARSSIKVEDLKRAIYTNEHARLFMQCLLQFNE